MTGGLRNLDRDRARGRVEALWFVAVGIALTLARALVEACAEKAFALDLHGELERPAKDRGDVAGAVFDQMFQDRLNGRILLSVHSWIPMVVSLHGIPDWIAPAGACPSRGATPAATEFPDLRLQYPEEIIARACCSSNFNATCPLGMRSIKRMVGRKAASAIASASAASFFCRLTKGLT